MQERRWWLTAAVLVLVGALPAGFAVAAEVPAPAAVPFVSALEAPNAPKAPVWADLAGLDAFIKYYAAGMAKAPNWAEASGIRLKVESALVPTRDNPGQPPFAFKDAYNHAVIRDFGLLVTSKNIPAAVNSTILVARLEDVNADGALADALSSPNPAVRYWGAKGLGVIMNRLKPVEQAYKRNLFGGQRAAVKVVGLVPAMQAEKSPLVRGELMRAVALSGSPEAAGELGKALQGLAGEIAAKPLDTDLLVAARAGLDGLATATRNKELTLGKAEQSALVQGTADIMSAVAQRLWAESNPGGSPLGAAEQSAAKDAIQAAIQAVNAVAAGGGFKAVPVPANLDRMNAADLAATVDDLTGTPIVPKGKLQGNWPDIKPPARIK